MELRISARHFELTPEIREYSEDKIFPLKKYYQHVIDASLILTLEKHRHQAELSFLLSGKKMFAKSETDDIYVSIDDAAAVIGILPLSGPNIVFISMYAQGILPFSVLLTNSIVQDGHGLLPILGFSVEDSVKIKVFNLAFGLIIGFAVAIFGF